MVRTQIVQSMLLCNGKPETNPDAQVECHVDGKARIRGTEKGSFGIMGRG